MVVKLTQEQADYLETFGEGDKNKAFHFISSWGWGKYLRDGLGKIYTNEEKKPFDVFEEKEKMLNALINGYEVIVPEYIFHNFSDNTGITRLYYAGEEVQLISNKKFAKEVEKDSDEYVALKRLGFYHEKV